MDVQITERRLFKRTLRLRGAGTAMLLRAMRSLGLREPKAKRNTLPWCQTHYVCGQSNLCLLYFERKSLKHTPPSSPRQVVLVGAPQVMPRDGEVLGKEGCWTRRWLLVGCCPGSWLIALTASPGALQKHSPPLHSLSYLLIDSPCQWLFALGRLSGRRRRGRLGRNGNSSAQEVDRVSFIFTKGERKSLRRVFPGRK